MNKIFSYKMHFASLLCTILIVLSHSYNVFYYLQDAPIKVYNIFLRISALAYICMTYFFFMSAYWLFRTYQPSQYINKLKSRFHSIVIPYIIFCFVGLIIKIIVNNGTIALNINTIFDAIFLTDYNGPLWYLLKLFILVILTPFLYQIIKRKKICMIGCLLLVIFNYWYLPDYYTIRFWLPVYLIGGWTSYHYHHIFEEFISNDEDKKPAKSMIIFIFLLTLLSMWGYFTEINAYSFYLTRVCCFPIIMLAFRYIPLKVDLPDSIQHSIFLLYCLHLPLRCIYGMIFDLFVISSSMQLCVGVTLLMGMIFVTVYLLAYILYTYANRLFLILTGGR